MASTGALGKNVDTTLNVETAYNRSIYKDKPLDRTISCRLIIRAMKTGRGTESQDVPLFIRPETLVMSRTNRNEG